jgi:predicted RNA-binding protein YlqC (UPF0109 family)
VSDVPESPDASADAEGDVETTAADGGRARIVLAYLADQLVDDRDAVSIETEPARNGSTRLSLRVAQDDMGKVIGRRGRVAQSIRGVVRAAAASEGRDVIVDIVD